MTIYLYADLIAALNWPKKHFLFSSALQVRTVDISHQDA